MSALVEAVARAICEASTAQGWREVGWTEAEIRCHIDEHWQAYVTEAEAAIAVIEQRNRAYANASSPQRGSGDPNSSTKVGQ